MMELRNSAPALVGLLSAAVLIGSGCSGSDAPPDPEPDPIANVQVAIAHADTLTETLQAYGTVIPAPGSVQSFAVPFESVVDRVLVNAGQRVRQGETLVRVSPSPEVRLAADQARAALESQRTVTDDTRQRFAMGLATRDDQARQEQALASAQSQVDKYSQWLEQDRLLAPASGLVRDVLTSEGALVPAGGPLVSIALQQRFEVRLGVEPEDIVTLHTGQTVRLQPVDRSGGAPVVGRIRSIGQQVSAETRLVEVMVAPPEGTQRLLLNQFVRAEVEVRDTRGLIVPRSAVLPHEDGFLLFTVKEGRATRHEVELGISTDRLVQVQGDGLADGDSVVVLGNYELTDGMGVRVIDSRPEGNPR